MQGIIFSKILKYRSSGVAKGARMIWEHFTEMKNSPGKN